MYATCGISPNDVQNVDIDGQILALSGLIDNKKIVAIGEIGLDYYWNKENKEIQKEYFIKQIELANKFDLPIVIHSRDAIEDTLDILKKNTLNKKGIFHCCMQNAHLIQEALKLGFYISFAGPITFKNSKHAEEVIKLVPLERILIETDSPYLAPEPKRGTRNDSRNVKLVAEKIAKVKQMDLDEISKITYENAKKIFNIK
jgi:TatD DNase family protein